ncbi:M20 family metallopeptidase [Clostridium sp.]|jgi:amidohydrolase|uniref:M20 metallopeptidase family protein n=1 Tax=Clostridium sp. TaxID=1506 RepID=UPI00259087E2|nr:M20 family metallopeptidase [Clostridium sp.]MDF2502644.1 amidohydrolase [Clostridium sp.]
MNFLNEANKIKDQLITWRRDFHSHPELDYELFRTNEKIKAFLDSEGIEYKVIAKTGICAIIKGANPGKIVALRGDMDALPLQEENKCDYASKVNGKMHACGHDAHTTILMGAAKLLNSVKSELNGNIKLFFEPAEETTGGARLMIAEGALENPKVDAVIGLHVEEAIEVGNIGVKKGVVNAASNPFTIKIKGKGGHGAHPDVTVDPVVISCNVVNALQTIISRELPPVSPGVVTIGYIHGGTAQNIIPEEVKIGGIIRTMKTEHRVYVQKRLREITEGIVTSMRGSCEIEIEESYPCLYNDDKILDIVKSSAEEVIGKEKINILENPSMGVESFAYFSLERPSAFYYLGCRNEEKGIVNPAHGSLFDVDEGCIPIGVAIQCTAAVRMLKEL